MEHTFLIQSNWTAIKPRLLEAFHQKHIVIVESFHYRLADELEAFCGCPYHGESKCNCQIFILLLYSDLGPAPISMVGHGDQENVTLRFIADGNNISITSSLLSVVQSVVNTINISIDNAKLNAK